MIYIETYQAAMERTAVFHGYRPPRFFAVAKPMPARLPFERPRAPEPWSPPRKMRFAGPYLLPNLPDPPKRRDVPIIDIQKAVAEAFEIPLLEMSSDRRARSVARPRQVSMYLCKRLTYVSLAEIGRWHGGRDHTTVLHATQCIANLLEKPSSFTVLVEKLEAKLRPGSPWKDER